jgi:hypothetical protein
MKQFKPYPIYINYSPKWLEYARQQADEFQQKGDFDMMNWMDTTGKRLLEIQEDSPTQSAESLAYEESVIKQLKIICQTAIGKLLFDSLNPEQEFWILYFEDEFQEKCGCAAIASNAVFSRKQGGGVRLYYDPSGFDPTMEYYTPDDILFHEMVHAYRTGRVGYDGQNHKKLNEYKSAEEFLAIHLQNVYLASRGKLRFYRSHENPRLMLKDDIYYSFSNDAEGLKALKYYLKHEPLAARVAKWNHPIYNPWRDHSILERIYLNKNFSPGLRFLPPL